MNKIFQKKLYSVHPESRKKDYPQPHKNNGAPFINQWAVLSHFVPSGLMPPEDQYRYINHVHKGENLYVCIAEEAFWVIIQNNLNEPYRVNPNRVIWIDKPDFYLEEKVITLNGTLQTGWISAREWHFKNKCFYYYIKIEDNKGKKVLYKRRYRYNDLSKST